ncbi:SMP-30/gluconolactonase/LRE family protein [Neisseria sp.]|uniref:SMP-30/gluconolactonase/LRE family protein n=1 Tax=Neisseria sp. TaxID=192066 RepID=UPI0035A0E0DF
MKSSFKASLITLTLATLGVACTPIHQAVTHSQKIAPPSIQTAKNVEKLSYITNIQSPEDLVQIPNTKWLIASGMAPKSGLYLVDGENKTASRLIAPKAGKPSAQFPNSEPQPHADEMQIHGISIREVGKGKFYLYAVNHNGFDQKITRETIEIFEVNTNTATPTLTWLGNVRMLNDYAGNGVVSGADGSIYVTVMMHPQHSLADMFAGKTTGAVYRWTPTTQQFVKLQGSELNGNNGIELSRDGKFIYVAHMQGMSKLTNTNPAKIVAQTHLDYGVADNLHWAGDKLITAGSMAQNCSNGLTFNCLKDFHITQISPDNLALNPIYKGKYTADFSGVSTVLPVGDTYYLGSFYRDKMAYFEAK